MAVSQTTDWQNLPACSICDSAFTHINRRHHCRTCHRCICQACSPSSISLEGQKGLQRACTPCVAIAAKAPELKQELEDLGKRLHSMGGVKAQVTSRLEGLEDTMDFCKAAINSLQDVLIDGKSKRAAMESRNRDVEARLRWEEGVAVSLGEELYSLAGGAESGIPRPVTPVNLSKAMKFCEMLAKSLSQEKERQAAVWNEQTARQAADLKAERDQVGIALSRAAQAEAAFQKEQCERRRLQNLLQEANSFCVGMRDNFPKQAATPSSTPANVASAEPQNDSGQKPIARRASTNEGANSALYSGESTAAAWQEDTPSCQICNVDFQVNAIIKKTRHHCRICGRCVCKQCSPNSVSLKGYSAMQKVCTPCVSNSQRAPEMLAATVQLANRISGLAGMRAPPASHLSSLGEALSFCESALLPLEAMLGGPSSPGGQEGDSHLHVTQARADNVRIQRELDETAARLGTLQVWSQWADNAARSLQSSLDGKALHSELQSSDGAGSRTVKCQTAPLAHLAKSLQNSLDKKEEAPRSELQSRDGANPISSDANPSAGDDPPTGENPIRATDEPGENPFGAKEEPGENPFPAKQEKSGENPFNAQDGDDATNPFERE